jgi:hypothetical protein
MPGGPTHRRLILPKNLTRTPDKRTVDRMGSWRYYSERERADARSPIRETAGRKGRGNGVRSVGPWTLLRIRTEAVSPERVLKKN